LENIFQHTKRPNPKLFFKKKDKNDIRLGEIIKSNKKDYTDSNFVLVGCPQDIGVKRNHGRIGARKSPNKIRQNLYKFVSNEKIEKAKLFDLGNIIVQKTLEQTHEVQEMVVSQILKDGKTVLSLGGGNDISYPDCKALSSLNKEILALNIDSHFDVRFNKSRNSGTSYFMLLEEKTIKGKNFWELGIKNSSASTVHKKYLEDKKANIIFAEDIAVPNQVKTIITKVLKENSRKNIFWGFDMDSVKASDAPGVSAPSPFGFSSEDAIQFAILAGKSKQTKVFEITEVNPYYDIDNRTSRLAALMIWYFIYSSTK